MPIVVLPLPLSPAMDTILGADASMEYEMLSSATVPPLNSLVTFLSSSR